MTVKSRIPSSPDGTTSERPAVGPRTGRVVAYLAGISGAVAAGQVLAALVTGCF